MSLREAAPDDVFQRNVFAKEEGEPDALLVWEGGGG
jgi:hypothetical protein